MRHFLKVSFPLWGIGLSAFRTSEVLGLLRVYGKRQLSAQTHSGLLGSLSGLVRSTWTQSGLLEHTGVWILLWIWGENGPFRRHLMARKCLTDSLAWRSDRTRLRLAGRHSRSFRWQASRSISRMPMTRSFPT